MTSGGFAGVRAGSAAGSRQSAGIRDIIAVRRRQPMGGPGSAFPVRSGAFFSSGKDDNGVVGNGNRSEIL